VAGEHHLTVRGSAGRPCGLRAHGDQDLLRGDPLVTALVVHHDGVRILEDRPAPDDGHVVAIELLVDDLALAPPDLRDTGEQLLERGTARLLGAAAGLRVPRRLAEAQHRLAEGLARDGARVDAYAADDATLLDDRRAEPELGRLDRRPLARRAAAETEEVEVVAH